MTTRRLAALALGGLLTACSLGPDFAPPPIASPAAWDAAPAPAVGVWPAADWWQGFGSAELDRLIALAMASNHDLAATVYRIEQAEAQARIAGAALLPSVSADGSAQRSGRDGGNGRAATATNSFQGNLRAAYQVDLFGANRAQAAAASQRVLSSRFDQATVAITLVGDVARAYFQVLSAQDRRRVAEQILAIAENILELLERTEQVGTTSALEVAQQRSAVASQRAALPALFLTERQALTALAVLVGQNPSGFEVATPSLSELRLLTAAAGVPSELLLRRPDLRRAESDLRAANLDTASARAARFPSLDLTVAGGTASQALSGLLGPGSLLYSLAASITAPIFQGGRIEAQEDLAAARFREVAEAYQQAVLLAFLDVQQALDAVQQNRIQYELRRQAFEQASEAYRLADLRYRAGAITFQTVLEAQRSVFQAADALEQVLLARFIANVDLYTALGGGWPFVEDRQAALPALPAGS